MSEPQTAQASSPLLAVRDVSVVFGGIVALNGVSFDMHRGQILGLIGPNGAGKTTLFNCLSRLYQPSNGDILMEGTSILRRPPHRIAEIGIGRTFQNVALFANLSVLDNVRIGAHARTRGDIIRDALRLPGMRRAEAALNERIHEILKYLGLDDVAHTTVSGLPFGTQKRVELARALATEPKILLLDEPSFGLALLIVRDLFRILGKINREQKVTILVVEQNAELALELADQAYVIETGRIVMSGSAHEIADNEDVRKSYLGY